MTDTPTLQLDVWNGNHWRRAGQIPPGQSRTIADPLDSRDWVTFECHTDHAILRRADGEQLRLEPGEMPEYVIRSRQLPATLVRFQLRA